MALELWALEGDPNDHIHGEFKKPAKTTVKIGGIPVIVKGDHAYPDDLCPGTNHCDPYAVGTSNTVYCYGIKIHRNNDKRSCDAKTVVKKQTTVKSG